MKPSAYLINIGRGDAVDEDALIDALSTGKIARAAADIFAQEPLQDDSPLWDMPSMIITPHAAPGTDLMGQELVDFWSENIRRFAEDEPLLGVVDAKAGY
jgi:phosphoglycerate dehydrogenase-like enzyme